MPLCNVRSRLVRAALAVWCALPDRRIAASGAAVPVQPARQAGRAGRAAAVTRARPWHAWRRAAPCVVCDAASASSSSGGCCSLGVSPALHALLEGFSSSTMALDGARWLLFLLSDWSVAYAGGQVPMSLCIARPLQHVPLNEGRNAVETRQNKGGTTAETEHWLNVDVSSGMPYMGALSSPATLRYGRMGPLHCGSVAAILAQ